MKNTLKYYAFYLIVLSSFIACKNDNVQKGPKLPTTKLDSAIVDFQFKDTLNINNKTVGSLKYNLLLDSIDMNEIDARYILLYVTTEAGINSIADIEKVDHEIFIDTIGHGRFNFSATFSKIGQNQLNGIIEDKIILNKAMEGGEIPIISRETSFQWPVFVTSVSQSKTD